MTNSTNGQRAHLELDWAASPRPTLCEEVFDRITIEKVGRSWSRQIKIRGQCPFCFGEFSYVHSLKLVPTVAVPSGQGSGAIDITIECHCAHRHPNAPDHVTGCGQYWTVEITR